MIKFILFFIFSFGASFASYDPTWISTPGIVKPKVCLFQMGGSGSSASPTVCSSNPCTEYYDSCGAVSVAPARGALGQYSFTFVDGTFKNSSPIICGATPRAAGSASQPRLFHNLLSTSSGGLAVSINSVISGSDTESFGAYWCLGQKP